MDMINKMGFPIVVSGFLLIRIDKKLETLNNTLITLINTFLEQEKKGDL